MREIRGAKALLLAALLSPTPLAVPLPAVLAQAAVQQDGLQLQVRRLPDAIELVIQDAGSGGALEQRREGTQWVGELRTDRIRGLKQGPQSLAMPDAGMDRITFDGTGRLFQLKITPRQGQPVAPPVVSSDGKNLVVRFDAPSLPVIQTARPNLSRPVPVPTPAFVPPLRPRASAPPVGDMAVGSMVIKNRAYINLSGPPVTITTRGANARDVLMVLAQMGGYGFAYSDAPSTTASGSSSPSAGSSATSSASTTPNGSPAGSTPVTVSFRNEPYERAFNFVLLTSGLQARREGNTILVGPNVLAKSIGSQLSKVYRLNQVGPNEAADYLANLGAQVTKTNTIKTATSEGTTTANSVANSPVAQTTTSTTITAVEAYGAATGPLLGLNATTDTRLGTITLFGEPILISIAEQYLKQLDLRQRQVALSVKILDVSLDNQTEIDNSFSARFGDTFVVNDGGKLLAQFGRMRPANQQTFANSNSRQEVLSVSGSESSYNQTGSSSSGRDRSSDATQSSDSRQSVDSQQTSYAENSSAAETTLTINNSSLDADTLQAIQSIVQTNLNAQDVKVNISPPAVINPSNPARIPSATGQSMGLTTISFLNNLNNLGVGQNPSINVSQRVRSTADIISRLTGSSVNTYTRNFGSSESVDSSASSGSNVSSARNQSNSSSGASSASRRYGSNGKTDIIDEKLPLNPGLAYPQNAFYDFLQAQIVSSSTKVLASPTLIIQEGASANGGSDAGRISEDGKIGREKSNEAFVRVGTQFVTSYDVKQDINGNNFCQPVFSNAGLTFGARVEKIDDNGFVTFSLSPEISAAVGEQDVRSCGPITLINNRMLDTGKVRVRDGQTLILTGVISEDDRSAVSKWPILGDLPLLGQFFRNSSGSRRRSELVIMVTPRIMSDDQGGAYGYGYQPSTQEARGLVYSPAQR